MNKFSLLCLILASGIILLLNYQAIAQNPASGTEELNSADLPKSTFHINPLGLLQFGPVFMYESKIGDANTYIVPFVRYGYLGVLTHVVWNADRLSPLNFGLGLGVKSYSLIDQSADYSDALYYGGFMDIHYGEANYDVGDSDETNEKASGLGLFGNFGYRWRFPGGNFINLGLIAGPSFTLSDVERYVNDDSVYAEYNETLIIGMIEFSFGWSR